MSEPFKKYEKMSMGIFMDRFFNDNCDGSHAIFFGTKVEVTEVSEQEVEIKISLPAPRPIPPAA